MTSILRTTLALTLALLCWVPVAGTQESFISSPRRALVAPELLDAPDEWIERSLGWADQILDQFPPAVIEHPVRRAALIRIDDVLHIESAPRKALVHKFYHERMEKAVADIERTRVTEGMRIWKLYNHGFLVRTPTVSFTFDIMRGTPAEGFPVEIGLIERIAEQADATFISHRHGDHADASVVDVFVKRGKPVIAPEGLWAEPSRRYDEAARKLRSQLSQKLTYPKRSATIVQEIPIQDGKQILKVVAYPGHQGDITNNVHLVTTPDGFTVIQTGDQSGSEAPGSDFDWIAHVGHNHDVDVLMPNCWTTNIKRVARGIDPKLIITGHENEMGHTVDHREDYTQTYNHLFGSSYPFIVMSWGESFHYRKR